jgi:hypothetical protein
MRTKNHTDRESIEHNALALCKVLVMWRFLSLGEIQGEAKPITFATICQLWISLLPFFVGFLSFFTWRDSRLKWALSLLDQPILGGNWTTQILGFQASHLFVYPKFCCCCWPLFRFIIEYSSLRKFWPLVNNNRFIFIWGFLKDDILACVETWD